MTQGREMVGVCELCSERVLKRQVPKHLAVCGPEHDAEIEQRVDGIVQLLIEAAGAPEYWLVVEGPEEATLQQLDVLLRRIWLECCGHMSAFRVGRSELAKRTRLGEVGIAKGETFDYDYDFGDTTALKGKVVGLREGSLGRRAVRVVARNAPFDWKCEACGEKATVICPFCANSGPSLFCKKDAPAHECDEEDVWLPVVNSPRMGICGYTGGRA